MKFIIEKRILLEGLNCVSKALSTRNIIPVLNGIKFDLTKKGLTLTATDNDITIQTFIDKKNISNIDEDGCTIIYGKTLLTTLSKLQNSLLEVENFENNEVTFKTETGGIYNFPCFNKEDFPNINLEEQKKPLELDSIKFKEIINNTSFACSLQESRPLLTGVNLKVTGDIFECVATDSYRLSKYNIRMSKELDNNINIVVPARNINEFSKLITTESTIELHVFSNKLLIKYDNILFQTSLLNGTYPNTDNSIPKDFKYQIQANLKDFYNLLDTASSLTQSKDKNIVDLEIKSNELIISANSLEGKGKDKINIFNKTKNNIKISFSVRYMLDALKVFNNEYIYILLNGEISPIILKEENNEELIELILPMKTY
jgi:DNA polymerase-3 subunit beta